MRNNFSDVNFLVGANGSGKSQYLNNLAERYNSSNYNIIEISNSIFDRFSFRSRNIKKLNIGQGERGIINLVVKLLGGDENEIYKKGSILAEVLEYIGYSSVISFCVEIDSNSKSLKEIDIFDLNLDLLISLAKSRYGAARDIEIIYRDLKVIKEKIRYLRSQSYIDKGNIIFLDLHRSYSLKDNTIKIYGEVLDFFRKLGFLKLEFFLYKNKEMVSIKKISSGECHMLLNLLFIASGLRFDKSNIILVDEPEISLHPKWQREYVFRLYDYFYKHNCTFFFATHSPLVISKVQSRSKDLYTDYIGNVNYKIFKLENREIKEIIEDADYSIEALYWEVFEILTPNNSFLSRYCIELLDRYDLGEIQLDYIRNEFEKLRSACDLEVQKRTLEDIERQYLLSDLR